jgi:hypothetical protein
MSFQPGDRVGQSKAQSDRFWARPIVRIILQEKQLQARRWSGAAAVIAGPLRNVVDSTGFGRMLYPHFHMP